MSEYYTYAYLRENGRPYYIGKGKGKRLFYKYGKNCKPPKDRSMIIKLKTKSYRRRGIQARNLYDCCFRQKM